MLPLVVAVVLGVAQLLAAGVGHELAAHAAENGAIALADGEDPKAAVEDALPGWAKGRVSVHVSGRRVRVRLEPVTVFPGTGDVLATEARADAGPAADGSETATRTQPALSSTAFGAVVEPSRDDPSSVAAELGGTR